MSFNGDPPGRSRVSLRGIAPTPELTEMMGKLERHNAKVRQWAARQPAKYRKAALAIGYRCDADTLSFSGTLEWISRKSRVRPGEGISRRTLAAHLKVLEKQGLVSVERRRNGDKNMSSVYTVDFGKAIEDEPNWRSDAEWDDLLAKVDAAHPVAERPRDDADADDGYYAATEPYPEEIPESVVLWPGRSEPWYSEETWSNHDWTRCHCDRCKAYVDPWASDLQGKITFSR